MSIDFATLKSLTIPEGVVKQIADINGNILWSADTSADIQPTGYLTFSSDSPFTLSVATPNWDGTMYYSLNTTEWMEWDGSAISSATIYLRGKGNTKVTGESSYKWTLTGTNISCNGNIETLLDYVTVEAGEHPTMANDCYAYMFYGCTSLTTAPELPATTLTNYCYDSMFRGCNRLTTAPELPATTLASSCYRYMFYGCTTLKLSKTKTDEYTTAYRIPKSGTGTMVTSALNSMFRNTGGTFTGTPSINTTYFLHSSNSVV